MTPEEVNMEIATRVMGWTEATPTDPRRLYWKGSLGPLETSPAAAMIGRYFDPMHRIEHSWMVVEKLESRQFIVEQKHDRWICNIQDKTGKWFDVDPQATAQEAICLAVLKAKEVV